MSAELFAGCLGWASHSFRYRLSFPNIHSHELLAAVFLALLFRDVGILPFRLPGRKRNSEGAFLSFGYISASFMWGLDIGLGITTWIAFGGYWGVIATILAIGDPLYAGLIMGSYWLGRTLSVWLAPVLLAESARSASKVIQSDITFQRRVHSAAMVTSVLVCIITTSKDWELGAW